jgi:hypothetical protein
MTAFHASADFETVTGTLPGASATPGRVTISAHSNGRLYLRNGLDGSRVFTLTVH